MNFVKAQKAAANNDQVKLHVAANLLQRKMAKLHVAANLLQRKTVKLTADLL